MLSTQIKILSPCFAYYINHAAKKILETIADIIMLQAPSPHSVSDDPPLLLCAPSTEGSTAVINSEDATGDGVGTVGLRYIIAIQGTFPAR